MEHRSRTGDSHPPLNEILVKRYLSLLHVPYKPPSLSALDELVCAHLVRVPFENISKLYRWKTENLAGIPSIEQFLDGIERYKLGGTCYSINHHFYSLLTSLGYDVRLCSGDMATPDVHMVIMAQVAGREYLIDAGYGAPFLAPIPRDLANDYVLALGRERYVLKPQDGHGRSRVELWRDGTLKHGYVAKPAARKVEDFRHVIASSFRPSATFLHAVLLVRLWPGRSMVIHNLTRIESCGEKWEKFAIGSRGRLLTEIEEHFGIPAEITREALSVVKDFQDAWN